MKSLFSYENIARYDLMSLVLDEYKNHPFEYYAFILDTSVSTQPYIKLSRVWLQQYSKINLYRNILKMSKLCNTNENYELYVFAGDVHYHEENELPNFKLVTDELIRLAECYEFIKEMT